MDTFNTPDMEIPAFVPLDTMENAKTGVVSDILGGVGATVGDFAASTFNSLVPEKYEVDTRDLIGRIGDNALKVYDENPDLIHTASFIGGIFVPTGLALKGMTALRGGMKGINWFSEAGKIDQVSKLDDMIRAGKMATEEYNVAKRSLYLRNFANNAVVDNAVAELAIIGTMNAHPYMEDYVKDPLSNFGTSMMLGAAIVGPLSHIGQAFEVKKLGMAAEGEAVSILNRFAKPVSVTEDYSMQVAQHQSNIDNWQNFLSIAGQTDDFSKLTTNLAENFIRSSKAAQTDAFNAMLSGEIKELGAKEGGDEIRNTLMQSIASNPELFSGINKISFASAKEETSILKESFNKLFSSTAEPTTGIPLTKTKSKVMEDGTIASVVSKDDMVYSPTFGAFMRKGDLTGYGVAADITSSEKNLTKGLTNNWYQVPNFDAALEADVKTAAFMDYDYLRKLKAVDSMKEEELSKIALSPEDGPMLNAVIARLRKMEAEGKDISALKVVMTSEAPSWGKIEEAMLLREIARNTTPGVAGVKPSYLQDIQAITSPTNLAKYSLLNSQDSNLVDMMKTWISAFSAQKPTREKFLDAFTTSAGHRKYSTSERDVQSILAGYNSPQSQAFRQEMMKHADSEGNVYLLRGLKQKAVGSNFLESFTTYAEKGAEFARGGGGVKWYKVKVDDIYGVMKDTAVGSAGSNKSVEVLVMAHTRDVMDALPTVAATAKKDLPPSLSSLDSYGIQSDQFGGVQKKSIQNLIANSYDDFMKTAKIADYEAQAGKLISASKQTGTTFASTADELEAYVKLQTSLLEQDAQKYINSEVQTYVADLNAYNSVKGATSVKSSAEATLSELEAQLLKNKTEDIELYTKMGFPPEVIRTRTNVPLETVKAIQASQQDLSTLPNKLYSNVEQIPDFINNSKRSLTVGTTMSKIPAAQLRSGIQNEMMNQVDEQIRREFLANSPSSSLREIAAFLFSPDNSKRYQMLKDGTNRITDSALGSKFFTSTDFTLRNMGEAGQIITAMGKDAAHLYDSTTKSLIRNVSSTFQDIIKDGAAVVEFNTARELNASIKGERYYIDGQFFTKVKGEDGKMKLEPVQYKGQDFIISTPSVRAAFEEMQVVGRELFGMNTTHRKILGMPALNDMGFWMPAFNPRDKYITYVIDNVDSSTKLLYGNTPAELASAEQAFYAANAERSPKSFTMVRKGADQALYNKIENRHDPMFMSVSDATSLHGGSSAAAIVPTSTNIFSELMNGYEHYIHRSVANHLELQYSEVMQQIDRLSGNAQSLTKGQPVGSIQKAMHVPTDAGLTVKNTLLGRNNLKEYVGWQDAQNGLKTSIELGLQSISNVMEPILNAGKGVLGKGKTLSDAEYEALSKDLADRGIPNPFQNMDDAVAKQRYHVEKISQAPNMTARMVALSNNFAATALLKVMELGQPLVNALSLPILTSAAVQRPFAAEYAGVRLAGNGQFSTAEAMLNGAKYLFNPEYSAKYKQMGKDLGITTPVLSEVGEFMQMSRSFNPGLMQKAENLMNSRTVEILSKPAIWSEQAVRELSFATGISLAKKAYPGLGDAGVMTFARNFVDTAIGNYNPAQRPALFQGTIGTAMGLFQTYMVTLMQQIYRGFELKDYKMLAKMALAQSSIFGVKSLPGFSQVSEQIGEHFSQDHYDFTTGTYRAVPAGVADVILYGMPSSLGPAVYTRGDIQPRVPNILGGVQNLAAVQILGQTFEAGKVLAKTTEEMGDEGATKAFMEALSIQSISRPMARISELVTGHAVTKKGNQIAGPEEVWSTEGIMARVLATRGLRETKAREAQFANSMYNTIDVAERNSATHQLKNHIRSGTLTPDIAERIQEKYMRTGNTSGWRSSVNTALQDTDAPGVSAVRNHLTPASPLNIMIDDID